MATLVNNGALRSSPKFLDDVPGHGRAGRVRGLVNTLPP